MGRDKLRRNEYLAKWREKNRQRLKEYINNWVLNNKEKRREYRRKRVLNGKKSEMQRKYFMTENGMKSRLKIHLKYTYKITPKQYYDLLEKQNGVCAVCFEPEKIGARLCVDHNHNCCSGNKSCGKCVRSLLCRRCNSVLGLCKDSSELLNKLIKYIGDTNEKLGRMCQSTI